MSYAPEWALQEREREFYEVGSGNISGCRVSDASLDSSLNYLFPYLKALVTPFRLGNVECNFVGSSSFLTHFKGPPGRFLWVGNLVPPGEQEVYINFDCYYNIKNVCYLHGRY